MNPEDEAEEDGANIDLDSQRKGKCVVLKTSTRQVKLASLHVALFLCLFQPFLGLRFMFPRFISFLPPFGLFILRKQAMGLFDY